MNYREFDVNDFICDEFFQQWVLKPDSETNHFWNEWLMNNPDKHDNINKARSFIEGVGYRNEFKMDGDRYSEMFERIVRYKKHQDIVHEDNVPVRRSAMWWIAIAASVLIVIGTVFEFAYVFGDEEQGTPIAYTEKHVPPGARFTTRLPDGTKVKINSNGILKYPEHFSNDIREVYLTGEAFFDVQHDPSRPFYIHTGNAVVKVLGTSFNVQAHADDSTMKVAVVSGKVKVSSEDGFSVLVTPQEMAVYKKSDQSISTTSFDDMEVIGWKEDILYFKRASLRDVFNRLEKWYGIDIKVSDNIAIDDTYSGEFHNETLKNVLEGICYTSGLGFKISDKEVEIVKP